MQVSRRRKHRLSNWVELRRGNEDMRHLRRKSCREIEQAFHEKVDLVADLRGMNAVVGQPSLNAVEEQNHETIAAELALHETIAAEVVRHGKTAVEVVRRETTAVEVAHHNRVAVWEFLVHHRGTVAEGVHRGKRELG